MSVPDIFRHAIERIMAGTVERGTKVGERPDSPESYGWLRRSDLDEDGREAWELPSGEIRLTAAIPAGAASDRPHR